MTQQEAYAWAARRCSSREMCPAEIAEKLSEKGAASNDIDDVVQRLIEEKYLDTARYARAFTHDKLLFQQWGRVKIRHHLRLKGIAEAEVRVAFEEIDEAEYRSVLEKVLRSKNRSLREADPTKRRQKLAVHAQTKGFELPLIFRCLDEGVLEDEE